MFDQYPKIPLHERIYCAIDDEYCRRKYNIKDKAWRAFHKNTFHVTHAIAYHLETLYAALLVIALSFAFLWNSFATTSVKLESNMSLLYPLRKISSFECRQLMIHWNELDENCKINLPIIKNANYDTYRDNSSYTNIYTTLWGDTYNGGWENNKWDHDGVDIATANGTPVYAIAHGVVTFAGTQAWYGNVVKLMFSYRGETYHAVFAHLSVINVRKWELVSQGQRLGAVGNSGNTFGALGWYHLHLEIDKDSYGRPLYAYANCPVLQTRTLTEITNNGLCREYRKENSFDAIAFIEASQKNIPQAKPDETVQVPVPDVIIPTPQSPIPTPPTPEVPIPSNPTSSTPVLSNKALTLRPVAASKLSNEAIQFLREWDIQIISYSNNIMNVGQSGSLRFDIAKKSTRQPFQGALPISISLISPNNWIKLSQYGVQYINNGQATIDYLPQERGYSTVSISIDGQTIAIMPVSIQ